MPNIVNSTKASALIREKTGRDCTRQNFEKLCNPAKNGPLTRCVVGLGPLRVDADLVVAEYLARVAPNQINAKQPRAKPKPVEISTAPPPPPAPALPPSSSREPEDIPDYNDSRARTEFEKANLLELDRKTKEGLLLPAAQVEKVWDTAVTTAKTKLLAVPTRLRQRIPHLSMEEVAIAEALLRECMEELVGGE